MSPIRISNSDLIEGCAYIQIFLNLLLHHLRKPLKRKKKYHSIEMSLSNFEIEALCRFYQIPLRGVFYKDQLSSVKYQNGNYIVNLDSSITNRGGTHWCLLIVKGSQIAWFDSFGANAPLEVQEFIHHRKYGFNNWIIQDLTSSLCGFYCLGLLLNQNMDLFVSMNDYVNLFVDNTKKNDGLLRKFFRHFPSPLLTKL